MDRDELRRLLVNVITIEDRAEQERRVDALVEKLVAGAVKNQDALVTQKELMDALSEGDLLATCFGQNVSLSQLSSDLAVTGVAGTKKQISDAKSTACVVM